MNNTFVPLPPYSFDSHWFGGFFGNKITRLVFCDQGLTVQDKLIPWTDITAPLILEQGALFDTLCVQCTDATVYIPWLAKRSFHHLFKQGLQHWAQFHSERLIATAKQCHMLIKQGYLRKRAMLAQIKQAQQVLSPLCVVDNNHYERPLVLHPSAPALFNKQTNTALTLLQVIAQWDEEQIALEQQRYIDQQMMLHRHYFSTVESNPLTTLQQQACVINERSNLVLAGAGTGKTSTMVGRAGYLITSGQARAEHILLLAFGRKAANEMDQRLALCLPEQSIKCSTFHSLGLHIIAQVEGVKPKLTWFVEDLQGKQTWLVAQFNQLLAQDDYRKQVLDYLSQYLVPLVSPFDFDRAVDYLSFMQQQGVTSLKGEVILGQSELQIANWLFQQGIEYEYQASEYTGERALLAPGRLFLPEYQITIVTWLLDEQEYPPAYLDEDSYLDEKDRVSSQTFNLISNHFCDLLKDNFFDNLAQQLTSQGVRMKPLSSDALYEYYNSSGILSELASVLAQMINVYKACWLDQVDLTQRLAALEQGKQVAAAVQLLNPLLMAYQQYLATQNEIDFDDMIGRAINYVTDGRFVSPWQHILVDEFQDISEPRARLLRALRDLSPNNSLFCVGDDWQAIYRFTGADVNLTTDFEAYFGDCAVTSLDKTFRFNNSIAQVSSQFVCQNPAQIEKTLATMTQVAEPAVSLLSSAAPDALHQVLNQILKRSQTQGRVPVRVLLLARYHHLLPPRAELEKLNQLFAPLQLQGMSIHASKGMEADYVVLLGIEQGSQGFPATKTQPMLLDALLPKVEHFAHAEERRLFYVALTRAKHRVYVIANMQRPSPFVLELLSDEYSIEVNEFDFGLATAAPLIAEVEYCPACDTGVLQPKSGPYGDFLGCSHYPFCNHTQKKPEAV